MPSVDVTAIVVSHDSAGVLPECLNALAREGAQLLVVDNASRDGSADVAERLGARVILNQRNEGYGRANNTGVAAAGTTFVLVANPDLTAAPGMLANLLGAAARWPEAGMWAPRIVEPDGTMFYRNRSRLCESVAVRAMPPSLSPPVRGDPGANLPTGDVCAPFLSGACFLMRRDFFLSLGGFDQAIFLYFEDDDLCRRVQDAGRALVHVHEAIARHARGQSASPRPGRLYKARWHVEWSRSYVARKWGLPEPAWLELAWNGLRAWLLWLFSGRNSRERYLGAVAGAWSALRRCDALAREGLSPRPDLAARGDHERDVGSERDHSR
jgi:N-acetylglucosaminyl-diphospho-decaprenol L-rhamnosyltransferase